MANSRYRVVETRWTSQGRVEVDIGCEWKVGGLAKAELRQLKLKNPHALYSIQKEKQK